MIEQQHLEKLADQARTVFGEGYGDLSVERKPSKGKEPKRYIRGNFAHKYARELIPNLPDGLSSEYPIPAHW